MRSFARHFAAATGTTPLRRLLDQRIAAASGSRPRRRSELPCIPGTLGRQCCNSLWFVPFPVIHGEPIRIVVLSLIYDLPWRAGQAVPRSLSSPAERRLRRAPEGVSQPSRNDSASK
ncbi:hypothetical protein SLUN_34705 [Streptomyces lunaelactis]|uniref:Uncharacterized protein n=1 Tax=Streptomyces lunaelactis TaxID=1535768 RepID=A0A2R4TBU0_9ACTN|nr:hypothetical protein SLUN_34705 [Streptomyces lunaelactis]